MTRRIFFANFLSALLIATVSALLVTFVAYRNFLEAEETNALAQLQLINQSIQQTGEEYLENFQISAFRLTWIDENGAVIFESHGEAEEMENHLNREEVQKAIATGFGRSSRNSATLLEEQFYYAQRLEDGSILRIANNQSTLWAFILSILQPLLLVFLFGGVFSAILAFYLSKSIMTPLSKLDLDNPLENVTAYDEISPMLHQIQRQYHKIATQLAEMSRKQEEFEIITRDMEEGLLLLGQHGQIISINDSACALFKANREESVEKNILSIHRSIEMQTLLSQAYLGHRSEGTLSLGANLYQISINPILEQELVTGLAILLVDITQKSESEQMRREFTANVSHELKTPLHSISGCAELLCHNLVQENDIPQFSEQIYNEAQRLIRLVDEIINLSRLDEGGEALQKETVDLASIAKEVVESLQELAHEQGISLYFHGNTGKMSGCYTLLSGIVRNLCENAIKYNRPHGKVEVLVEEKDSSVILEVSDTGIGVSEQEKDLIFQRFYRVDKSRSKEIGGTGLGLSIVKHSVGLHQGVISIESTLGQGSNIQVVFPSEQ